MPATPRERSVSGISAAGFHRLAYVDWGPANGDTPVLCVHGVTRQSRDFDFLANTLTRMGRRVICPDLPGRGRSERLSNPDDYALPQYCADINTVIARTGAQAVDYVGTSLGGLIGMILAGMVGTNIRRLVINDIGPYVSSTGLSRIGAYLRELPVSFTTLEKAQAYFRSVLEPYGDLTESSGIT
ncbi:alpha/beta hydrolase fold [Mesorhizobium albiziae]|uniref:Alpha/beta hydrolase fold n=1 Tax=Neomesorhizobium albiziae TaxID=335020 RepID=A0A1I3XWR3_9HYPH|nr:hypothetical protein GCM10007937_19900 [Mesorhizobium albiziae]SFK23943.1 alpha/beta hydrolase fold [Mesorhizobium albiziae]